MRYILILLLLVGTANAQYSPTSAKSRFVNGLALGTKLDSYFNTADSNAIYWRADSVVMAKYKGTARALAFQQYVDSAATSGGSLKGQDWIIYGDSYSDNLSLDYPGRVRDRLGLNATTKAKAGARIYTMNDTLNANLAVNPSFLNDYDIISLHVGVNDFAASDRPLGKATDAVGADNIAGQFKYFIDTVLAKNPMIKFFLITPPEANGEGVVYQATNSQGWTMRDLSLLIGQIGALYSVQVIDLYNMSQLNLQTIPTMLPDGLHPGFPEGRTFMGDIVAQSFLSNSNKGKYADPYKVTNGFIPLYDGTTFKNSIIQADANRVTISGATTSQSSVSIENTSIDSTLFLRVRNSTSDSYFGINSTSGAFFPLNPANATVIDSRGQVDVNVNNVKITSTKTTGFDVIGNIYAYNGSINTDTGSVNVDSGNVNINIGSLNIDTGNVNVTQGNINVSSGTPLLTLTASTTAEFHGVELKNGSSIDAFFKHKPSTAELRISSGRSALWGGFTTFYQDGVEVGRFAPTSGALLINEISDNGVDKFRMNGSGLFDNRTRVGGGYIADIGGVGNSTGIFFGSSAIYSINGSGTNTVKNLGDASNRWGIYYGSEGNFNSSVTASSFIRSGGASTESLQADGSVQTLTSGTYTPTLTNTTNLSASSLSYATYTRIGNVVHVNIGLGLTPTLSATNTVLTVTLPFTAVNGTQNYVGSGTVFGNLASNLFASGMVNVTSTTQATFTFYSTALTASSANFQFQYILN